MHEFGIAMTTLKLVLQHAASAGVDRVSAVGVQVGAVSGVDPEAFRFAFGAICTGTPAECAELDLEIIPAVAHCIPCDCDFGANDDFIYACPHCGGLSATLVRGRELVLSRIELSPAALPS